MHDKNVEYMEEHVCGKSTENPNKFVMKENEPGIGAPFDTMLIATLKTNWL